MIAPPTIGEFMRTQQRPGKWANRAASTGVCVTTGATGCFGVVGADTSMTYGTSILIVEDDRVNREAMARLARHAGFDVDTAASLAEARDKLPASGCILLDIVLPDGRGLDLLRQIREENRPLHVAIVSGSMAMGDLGAYETFDPDAVFVKPVKPDDVLHWLGRHCPAKAGR